MTLSDLEWSFHGSASRAFSAVAELLVNDTVNMTVTCITEVAA